METMSADFVIVKKSDEMFGISTNDRRSVVMVFQNIPWNILSFFVQSSLPLTLFPKVHCSDY